MQAQLSRRAALAAAAGFAVTREAAAQAPGCGLPNPARATEITTISNSFPLLQFLTTEMRACSGGNLRVESRLTADNLPQTRVALAAGGNTPFQLAQVSNATFTEFVNRGQLQPMHDLVDRHRAAYGLDDIPAALWREASFEGRIHALPFQTNVHLLFYRRDLFEKHGLSVPRTIEQMIATARTLREREPTLEHPLANIFGRGWNVATEFANYYQSLGGAWLDDRAQPIFNDAKGVAAIEAMREMLPLMSPNALAFSGDDVTVAFQQGRSAMGVVWASRAASMEQADVSRVRGLFAYAPAPAMRAGGLPSSALWWDGWAMPARIAPDRDLVFRLAAAASTAEVMRKGGGVGAWSRASVINDAALAAENRHWRAMGETVAAGVKTFPTRPSFSLAHTAIGANITEALQGRISAKDALDRAAAAYLREARSQGFL
jgi:ABC-type glycerol-3-phosphate transport system substrate-binding protein